MNTLRRIFALVRKELQVIFGDPQSRSLVFLPILLQALLFPLAATLEVKNNTLAILNEDGGRPSIELAQRLARAAAFTETLPLAGEAQATAVLDAQKAIAVVRFPSDFSRRVAAGQPAPLQLLLDGRRSNSSQIASAYIQEIVTAWFAEQAVAAGAPPASELVVRHRYNPNLDYTWFTLPNFVAVILTISSLILTALSVAREREQGTFDQLLVSPLTPPMIMLGKGLAALAVGLVQASAVVLSAVWVYHVPLQGSLLLLYGSAILYFAALVGVGLLISAVCSTQQQAFLGAFAFMMPAILLSGFASPVENMPDWLQVLTWPNPLRHFIDIVNGIFLKDVSTRFVLHHSLPMLLTAAITLGGAITIYKRRFG